MSNVQSQTHDHKGRSPRRKTLKVGAKLKSGGPAAHKIADLLAEGQLRYDQIAERVQEELPGTRTSARSVASVASRLRKEGFKIADRRLH